MLRILASILATIALALPAAAQPAAKPLKFEVASIKPSDPNAKGSSVMTDKVGGLRGENMPIRGLITMAYGIRDFQLSGAPGWLSTERYDIMAKPEAVESGSPAPDPSQLTDEQRGLRDERWRERVRNLLADRFGLVVHKETKEAQIYHLVIAKGGPKLKEVSTPGPRQGMSMNTGRAQGFAAPMKMLADNLAGTVGRPVIDMTGLAGKYDWKLEWTPDPGIAIPGPNTSQQQPVDAPGPTIFTAVQEQLGLKLETARGPVDTWVIDKIEHPSGN
ncbi:MAG TPA: TIGR03435 family protein [Bryobacteraceae bacterium]|nr:TIGR03435 family protein [Bryobacteraceae bacterium]